LKVLNLWI
jgi:hypothetical protein